MLTCENLLVGCGVGDKVGLAVGLREGSENGAVLGEAAVHQFTKQKRIIWKA